MLLDRKGKIAGYYRKIFVFWGEGLHVSMEGVKIFDTDFGRISILTCFDLNFPELWHECDAIDVDIEAANKSIRLVKRECAYKNEAIPKLCLRQPPNKIIKTKMT